MIGKIFYCAFAVAFLLGVSTEGPRAEGDENYQGWKYLDYSFLSKVDEAATQYTLFDSAICQDDNLGSTFCFDYGWRNNCLEVLAIYILSDEIAYILSPETLPSLQVGGHEKLDLNPLLEVERKLETRILPWSIIEDRAFWRVAVGSIEKHQETKEGLVYQLLNGERIDIYFKLQNGDVMRSHATLNGIKPLLEGVLDKAAAAKPEGPACQ